ncbi:MAG: flagellin [Eubacterium sp.]|nr:flagellin [Eubacterium sp.]
MKVNNNIEAQRANFNLNAVQRRLTQSTNRLSSGYRIVKAADDAAGMAISHKMHAQIRGLMRASDNGSDGISFIQTTEGALNEVEEMLQRCRELSVQAANIGTTTIEDRVAIQQEIDQLKTEIDRISRDTEFNTMTVLDGTCTRQSSSSNIGVKLISASDEVKLTSYTMTLSGESSPARATTQPVTCYRNEIVSPAGSISINDISIELPEGITYEEAFSKIRDTCGYMNIEVSTVSGNAFNYNETLQFTTKTNSGEEITGSSKRITVMTSNSVLASKFGIPYDSVTSDFRTYGQGKDVQVSLDTSSGFSGTATAFVDGGRITVTDRAGFEMVFDADSWTAGMPTTATVTMLDAGYVAIQIGANEGQTIDMSVPPVNCKSLDIVHCNVCTGEGAQEAITAFDLAVTQVTTIRSKLGAYQNRLEHAVASVDEISQNLTEACSRIEDVDMSEEMTAYTQYQVLVQAGVSMLSQANNQPQTILQMLQG